MQHLRASFFGKFELTYNSTSLATVGGSKAKELLCYLFLHHSQPHPRVTLATLLWQEGCTTSRAKAYLRKALWQLQRAFEQNAGLSSLPFLEVEPEWVQLHTPAEVWFDVEVFERAYETVKGIDGKHLGAEQLAGLEEAVELYTGDLLENWYQRWCLRERDRMRRIYLLMLDKLLDYSLVQSHYERGLDYGERILRVDLAREQTHRQLMRLRFLSGDRTGALRQYQRCVSALEDELDARPCEETVELQEQIRTNAVDLDRKAAASSTASGETGRSLQEHLDKIQETRRLLKAIQDQIQGEIEAIEAIVSKHS